MDGTEIIWKGVVTSTTSIGSLSRVAGASDTGNSIGDYVMLLPASDWANQLVAGLLVEHNQDGTHGAITSTNATLTTPKIVTSINDANGNEVIKTPATASAVNEITVTNAAAGNAPQISATGDDTNIDLNLAGQGAGKVKIGSSNKTTDANGWTVYDYGAWKVYKKQVTFSASFATGGTVSFSSSNLPVGVSTIGTNVVSYALLTNGFGYDFSFNFDMTTSSSALAASAKCISGNARTYTCVVNVTITST